MPTLELLVEIDSEVHPELYAVLAAVGRDSLRPERLRQLAGGGLIWEHLRAQPRLDAAAQPAMAAAARQSDRAAAARSAVRAVAQSAADAAAGAVTAVPVPAPEPEPPPVLQDVVEMNARPAPAPRARKPAAPPVEEPPVVAEVAEPPLPDFAAPKKPGPRSRLLLMKERGLFKNS